MWRVGAQRGTACVPSEMMQFVTNPGHFGTANDLAVGGRSGVEVEHAHRIVAAIFGLRIEHGDIAQFFLRPLHRHSGRRIKRLIRLPKWHVVYPPRSSDPQTLAKIPIGSARPDASTEAT